MRSALVATFALLTSVGLAAVPPDARTADAPPSAVPMLAKAEGLLALRQPKLDPAPDPKPKVAGPPKLSSDGAAPKGPAAKFLRGGKRSPVHKLLSTPQHVSFALPPPQFSMIPAQYRMWGNDQYGCCVSSQECCSMAAWTTYCGSPVVPTDAECIAFARKHGWLNGAWLTEVMDTMISEGMLVGGKMYKDGPYKSVNYSDITAFQSALTVGPVNVAIDSSALPSGAGNATGWYSFGGSPEEFPNTDHCITFLAFGPASYCFQVIGKTLPAGVDANKPSYVCHTWNTLGVVDQAWVRSTMAESWVRSPTTVGFAPKPPDLPPVVTLIATPASGPAPLTTTFTYTNAGGPVESLTIKFGDSSSGIKLPTSHAYNLEGSYTATLTATGPGGVAQSSVTVSVGVVPPPPPPPGPNTITFVSPDGKRLPIPVPAGWRVEGAVRSELEGLSPELIAAIELVIASAKRGK